jgi:Tropinone reductase 1
MKQQCSLTMSAHVSVACRKAIVDELLGLGASVYTCARREEDITSCIKEWKGAGLSAYGSACDVTDAPAREELFQKVAQAFDGKLDILVSWTGTCTFCNISSFLSFA